MLRHISGIIYLHVEAVELANFGLPRPYGWSGLYLIAFATCASRLRNSALALLPWEQRYPGAPNGPNIYINTFGPRVGTVYVFGALEIVWAAELRLQGIGYVIHNEALVLQ